MTLAVALAIYTIAFIIGFIVVTLLLEHNWNCLPNQLENPQ